MLRALKRFLRHWSEYRRFSALPEALRRLVVYSEGPGYWSHFEPVISALLAEGNLKIAYVTSSDSDPLLQDPPCGLVPFAIGDGSVRTIFFQSLQADVLLMTMPDLESFHIKRSVHPVHYVYLHHSIVSTHMVYRPGAFDHFDTILCVGPHHIEETRKQEKLADLPEKRLVKHGYGRLDRILQERRDMAVSRDPGAATRVLVAPSWGAQGVLETQADSLVEALLDAGFHVTVRPHPQTRKLAGELLDALVDRFGTNDRFVLEEDVNSRESLLRADVMISDWSGAAFEFAFGMERPVVFVDVPRKVNNPDYEALDIEPLEVSIREEIGAVVPEKDPAALVSAVQQVCVDPEGTRRKIIVSREQHVFNVGESGKVGADAIRELL